MNLGAQAIHTLPGSDAFAQTDSGDFETAGF
jgi:hypothetical protein